MGYLDSRLGEEKVARESQGVNEWPFFCGIAGADGPSGIKCGLCMTVAASRLQAAAATLVLERQGKLRRAAKGRSSGCRRRHPGAKAPKLRSGSVYRVGQSGLRILAADVELGSLFSSRQTSVRLSCRFLLHRSIADRRGVQDTFVFISCVDHRYLDRFGTLSSEACLICKGRTLGAVGGRKAVI